MLIQQIAPVDKTEFASVFVALELSRSNWLVGIGTSQKWTVGRHQVEGGDLDGLLALLSRLGAGEENRSGLLVKVVAGRRTQTRPNLTRPPLALLSRARASSGRSRENYWN